MSEYQYYEFLALDRPLTAAAGRTAAELWEAAGDHKAVREKAAEERRHKAEARKAAAEAAAYAKRLDQLATRTEEAWQEAAELIETKRHDHSQDYPVCVAFRGDSPVEYWSEEEPEEPSPFGLNEVNRRLAALGREPA